MERREVGVVEVVRIAGRAREQGDVVAVDHHRRIHEGLAHLHGQLGGKVAAAADDNDDDELKQQTLSDHVKKFVGFQIYSVFDRHLFTMQLLNASLFRCKFTPQQWLRWVN